MKAESNNPVHYIKKLIESGESQQLDFKFEISNARKIARTFSAFANTMGGKLLIGVKDNGRISGVRSDEEAYMAESGAHIFCRPSVTYNLKKWVVEGKTVLEVDVPMSKNRPHFARDDDDQWVAYVRVGDQNIKANQVLINVWKRKGMQKGILLNYGREEKALLAYLSENENITLSKFTRLARINRAHAERLLINLILMQVVEMEITERAVFYKLKRQVPES